MSIANGDGANGSYSPAEIISKILKRTSEIKSSIIIYEGNGVGRRFLPHYNGLDPRFLPKDKESLEQVLNRVERARPVDTLSFAIYGKSPNDGVMDVNTLKVLKG